MSGILDKFSSGSHSAKNGADIHRKEIIRTTFAKMRDNFGYASTNMGLVALISEKAGKFVRTRKLIIDGKIINFPA